MRRHSITRCLAALILIVIGILSVLFIFRSASQSITGPVVSLASDERDVVADTPDVKRLPVAEELPLATDSDAVESDIGQPLLEQFYGLSAQEILIEVAREAVQGRRNSTETLLALMDAGIIDANTPMRQSIHSEHYTPLFTALLFDKAISVEQVQQFLDAGAYLQYPERWIHFIPTLENTDAAVALIDHAALSVDMNERVISSAFSRGNQELFRHLTSDSAPGILDSRLSVQLSGQLRETLSHSAASYEQAMVEGQFEEHPGLAEFRLRGFERNQQRIRIMLSSQYLTMAEREWFAAEYDNLQSIVEQLNEIASSTESSPEQY